MGSADDCLYTLQISYSSFPATLTSIRGKGGALKCSIAKSGIFPSSSVPTESMSEAGSYAELEKLIVRSFNRFQSYFGRLHFDKKQRKRNSQYTSGAPRLAYALSKFDIVCSGHIWELFAHWKFSEKLGDLFESSINQPCIAWLCPQRPKNCEIHLQSNPRWRASTNNLNKFKSLGR